MSKDHRIVLNGVAINFTCKNAAFETDVKKGSHLTHKGSALPGALVITQSGHSLWLEHVLSPATGTEWYWLMWYDRNGIPTIPLSGVMTKSDIVQLTKTLAELALP